MLFSLLSNFSWVFSTNFLYLISYKSLLYLIFFLVISTYRSTFSVNKIKNTKKFSKLSISFKQLKVLPMWFLEWIVYIWRIFLSLYNILTSENLIVLILISNIKKKISFFILLNIKLGLFWRAFLDFCQYFANFKDFLVSRLGVTNGLLHILAIQVVVFLQFLFWMRMILYCNGLKVFYLLPKYIKMN